jgi:hypothetical protein
MVGIEGLDCHGDVEQVALEQVALEQVALEQVAASLCLSFPTKAAVPLANF